jgi:hypothetical protein
MRTKRWQTEIVELGTAPRARRGTLTIMIKKPPAARTQLLQLLESWLQAEEDEQLGPKSTEHGEQYRKLRPGTKKGHT